LSEASAAAINAEMDCGSCASARIASLS